MTLDDSDPARDAIHQVLQANGSLTHRGAVLTGWAVVTQWMDPDGESWVARAHSASLPAWGAKGLWHEALYGDWDGEEP